MEKKESGLFCGGVFVGAVLKRSRAGELIITYT